MTGAKQTVVAAIIALTTIAAGPDPFANLKLPRFGSSTADVQRSLESKCASLRTRRIDPPFLREVRTEQLQVDCDGFQFLGRSRRAEFVIRDGRLVMVWLMVEGFESNSIIKILELTYGPPSAANDDYIAFEDARVAWRHRPAEILFYGEELEQELTPRFH